ncbi:MAG: branched-chain amino acid ABC transporter substrate-binding protein [Chloroflexota bacterium]|nr:branched-chain amino acid ABC transporter substrate-binding protein [Chloroflexota bacterium]
MNSDFRIMRTRILHILLLAFLLTSLCACGPDEKDIVKIVASIPLDPEEGVGAGWEVAQGMQLALEGADFCAGDFTVEFELLNASGPDDDVLIPEMETTNAEKAANDLDVLVYLGSTYSSGCKISVPILNRAGVAQISPSATYPGLTKSGFGAGEPAIYYPTGRRTFFRVVTTDDMQGPACAFWVHDLGLKRVYILEQDDAYGHGLARAFDQAAESAGLTIVGVSTFVDGQSTGLDEIAADVSAQQPDLVYYTGFRSTGVPMVLALREEGVAASFMGADGIYTSSFIDGLGADAEGVMSTFTGVPLEALDETGQNFVRRFQERFGHEPGGWSVSGYDVMGIALAAIEQAGQADRAAVVEALHEIEFEGMVGCYSFDENGDTHLLLISGMCVEDGRWELKGLLRVR